MDSWGKCSNVSLQISFLEYTFHCVMDFKKQIEDLVVEVMDHNKGNDVSV